MLFPKAKRKTSARRRPTRTRWTARPRTLGERITLGLSSTSSVFAALRRLTEAGYLERADWRVAPTKKFFARPILGSVRAGLSARPTVRGQYLQASALCTVEPVQAVVPSICSAPYPMRAEQGSIL